MNPERTFSNLTIGGNKMKGKRAVWKLFALAFGLLFLMVSQVFAAPIDTFRIMGEAIVSNDGVIQLTDLRTHIAGGYWSQSPVDTTGVTEIEFEFLMYAGSGADGLAVSFALALPQTLGTGEFLGFYGEGAFGIEFDTYYNEHHNDVLSNHIAVIQNSVGNHLRTIGNMEINDGKWHRLKIRYQNNSVAIHYDGNLIIDYTGVYKFDSAYIGISAATGGSTQYHLIRNVKLTTTPDEDEVFGCSAVSLASIGYIFVLSAFALFLLKRKK
jgi:hypothetical protein